MVFMPMTLVASIYGMNFKHMPELDWVWGYPLAIGAMILIGLALIVYFRKKGWLGSEMNAESTKGQSATSRK